MKQLGRGAENKARRQKIRKKKKAIFILCLVLNFGMLFFLKYLDVWTWALPLGISFYTFQSMGYLIDVFTGEEPMRSSIRQDTCSLCPFFRRFCRGRLGDMSA